MVNNKLYKVVIYKYGKKITQAFGQKLDVLKQWALDCQKEDKGITFDFYVEEKINEGR